MNLGRRVLAEGLGSFLLAAAVIGSGIMAERLAGGNVAIALLANTAATVAVLAVLIAMLGPISGAHFNPAVSLIQMFRQVNSRHVTQPYMSLCRSRDVVLERCSRMPCLRCRCCRSPLTRGRVRRSGCRK